ncbi:MAG: TetR/AcrR family transcriptional regulator [Xanthobacteraceae bacterium]
MPRNLSVSEIKAFREGLCAVAERLFAERGAQAVTMRELARELDVSAMTPYRYFQDKDEILAAVRAAAFDRFAATIDRAAAIKGSAPARANAVGRAYVDFAFRQPNAYKLMFDVNQPDAERFPDLVRAGRRARQTMAGYTKALVAEGYLTGDPETLGKMFWAMVHGLVMLQLTGRLDPKPDFATLHRTAMRMLARGAGASTHGAKRRAS